jgi:hypothetical protein
MVTAGVAVVGLGFVGFVATVVTGHAPQDITEKVRQTVRETVNRVVRLFTGSHQSQASRLLAGGSLSGVWEQETQPESFHCTFTTEETEPVCWQMYRSEGIGAGSCSQKQGQNQGLVASRG